MSEPEVIFKYERNEDAMHVRFLGGSRELHEVFIGWYLTLGAEEREYVRGSLEHYEAVAANPNGDPTRFVSEVAAAVCIALGGDRMPTRGAGPIKEVDVARLRASEFDLGVSRHDGSGDAATG